MHRVDLWVVGFLYIVGLDLLLTDAGTSGRAAANEGLLSGALGVLAALFVERGLDVFGVVAADGGQVVGGVLLADDAEEAGGWVGEDAEGE
jgi:hypothetical protein